MQKSIKGKKAHEGWKSNLTFEVSKSKTFTTDFTFKHFGSKNTGRDSSFRKNIGWK